ncbi:MULTISPECIES: MerR family transcriptional regulator [unclassified Dyella]|uniref:MerR family transcriptional regulator n=1 Tax=unclassified Dyella TaxID=2634549 RepID=UPI000C86080C|nr:MULTISPECIES: MerR family transcriptional regulator [unclassified Dyella]MDR3446325.1 MerR family transcriptional regulator [Dyella sp.]PMQ04513.1 Nodulation protein NolA [Dyella sp. AD56]
MELTVGELARRSGLTIRTLHHYDAIGLLVPSLRSAAGYRLYDRANIERLHRIQALRQLGLSLADIGTALSGPQAPLTDVIERQMAQLDHEITKATRLRKQLGLLHAQLASGQSPDLADWLDTLELMTMFENYFSSEEIKQLPLLHDAATRAEWSAMVSTVQAAMDRGVSPEAPEAQILALRWMRTLYRDTSGNPDFLVRLNRMHDNEPGSWDAQGVSLPMRRFIEEAFVEGRLAIYQRYLKPGEFAFMRQHYGATFNAWPPLLAALRKAMVDGVPPGDPQARELGKQWAALFRAYAGDDPATHERIREAHAKEPDLTDSSWSDEALIGYVRTILAALQATPRAH